MMTKHPNRHREICVHLLSRISYFGQNNTAYQNTPNRYHGHVIVKEGHRAEHKKGEQKHKQHDQAKVVKVDLQPVAPVEKISGNK